MPATQSERDRMVEQQIIRRGVRDPAVLQAMREVPRDDFVPERLRASAHADHPLPIGSGQTISQPYIVALMIESAALRPGDRVLEVGAGSGYAAAVMGRIAGEVHAVERHPDLAEAAAERLRRLGVGNVKVHAGDGTLGWPAAAAYDAVIVSAGGPAVPVALTDQLAEGGRLVMPVGDLLDGQRLVRLTREGRILHQDDLGGVRFVPLIGAQGWTEDGRPALDWLR